MKSVIPHPKLKALKSLEQETNLIRGSLRADAEEALDGVDFDAFTASLEARLQQEAAPIAPVVSVEQPSFFQQCVQWFQTHQGFALGTVCACAALGMFILPMMDKGPSDTSDVIVEKILKKRSTRVAVVQTKSQSGQPMTVVIINEAGMLTDQIDKKTSSPKDKKKTPSQP